MKCSIMLHFIRVYTVCEGKNDLQTIFENFNLTPLDMYNGLSQVYLYQTRRKNPLVYKGLTLKNFETLDVASITSAQMHVKVNYALNLVFMKASCRD